MIQQGQFGRLLEPGLRKIFFDTYQELPEQYSQVFNVMDSKKAIETDYRMGAFGLFERKDSAGSVQYQDLPSGLALQYIHEEFASGFTIERKMIEDEQYNTINKNPKLLGRAARATVETKAIEVLNNAFTTNGFDGVPLISSTHKRLDGGTMSNKLEADVVTDAQANGKLSDRNLKGALVQMRKQVDDKGILIQTQPDTLIVSPQLEFQARTMLESAALSTRGTGSAYNSDKNLLKDRGLKLVVMDYLNVNGGNGWFLMDSKVAQLNFFWRNRLEFNREKDFDTMQSKFQAYMRFSVGFSDYRGIVGSDGSGTV